RPFCATPTQRISAAGDSKRFTMLIKRPSDIDPSEITPQGVYMRRREFLAGAASLGLFGTMSAALPGSAQAAPLQAPKSPRSTTGEPLTWRKDIPSYNNCYEFGTDKGVPARNARSLTTAPWKVKIVCPFNKPAEYDYDDLIKPVALEGRVYRMRCVEGW